MFKQTLRYIRQTQNLGLLSLLAMSFSIFPFVGPVMLPGILLTHVLYSLFNVHNLIGDSNKNLDKWLGLMTSIISTTLVGAAFTLTAFTIGMSSAPWLFISSILVGAAHQLITTILDLYRAFEAPAGSEHRKHYLKQSFGQLMLGGLIAAAAIGTTMVLFQMPIAFATAALSLGVVLLATETAVLGGWKMLPKNWRNSIKDFFAPYQEPVFVAPGAANKKEKSSSAAILSSQHYGCIFTRYKYCSDIKVMELHEAKDYLLEAISIKSNALLRSERTEKNLDKLGLLSFLHDSISNSREIPRNIYKGYPLAFQNFLAEKGEVHELFDAALLLQKRYQNMPEAVNVRSSCQL